MVAPGGVYRLCWCAAEFEHCSVAEAFRVDPSYNRMHGEWRARRTIGCRGGNRNWNGGWGWGGVGWGVGWVVGGGGKKRKPQKGIHKVAIFTKFEGSPVSQSIFCFGGSFFKMYFRRRPPGRQPLAFGEIRGPIWRPEDHLVMK